MATIVGVGIVAALVWVLVTTLWLWRHQERVVFQPPAGIAASESAKRVHYIAADGHQLFGYLVMPAAPASRSTPSTVVIAFHGNADLAAWLVPWARELAERAGVNVLLPELRGYAGIPGTPTYVAAGADGRGALQFVRDEMRPARIVLFGHSLGTGIAVDLAAAMQPERPDALVLQSPFTSARAMAARMLVPAVPWLWRRISRVHYDTRALVARLDIPVWVSHGTRDVVVPVHMGREVFAAARNRGELLLIDGAGHNDVPDVGAERYWQWLTAAVTTTPSVSVREFEEERHRHLK